MTQQWVHQALHGKVHETFETFFWGFCIQVLGTKLRINLVGLRKN